ncbi:MAG TPA: hypothetical protein VME70_11015 [Mycobacteriales bacterium]|nr:hypothetical protein [Mycobacteriales bacterium]
MSAAAPLRRSVMGARAAVLDLPEALQIHPAPRPRPVAARPRPRFVVATRQGATAGRIAFLALVGALLVGGLVAVLLLHMMAAQDGFRVTALQQRVAALTDEVQEQQQTVAADSSPTVLQARAKALGMVPSAITSFHRRPDGRAVGIQTPVYVAPPTIVGSGLPGSASGTKQSASGTKQSASGTKQSAPGKQSGTGKQATKTGSSPAPTSSKQPSGPTHHHHSR